MSIVRFRFRFSSSNKPDLVAALLFYPFLVVSVVVGVEVMGVGARLRSEVWWRDPVFLPPIACWGDVSWPDLDHHGRCVCGLSLRAVVPWRDLVFPRLGKSSSRPNREGCFRLIRAVQGGFLGLREPCLLLISGGVQEFAMLMTRPALDCVHITALQSEECVLLDLVLCPGVLGWPARWRSGPSSSTQLQSTRTSLMPIPSIGAPGYNDCFFLLEYAWIASSSITKSCADKMIPKPGEMCHLFLLVTCVQYHQHLISLVIMAVTANSGKMVCEAQVYAFEASSVTYQMTSMLVGEMEHNDTCLCCIWIKNGFEDASDEGVRAFPFEIFHRWQVRASSLLVLRFNGKDKLQLSSVKLPTNLRLSSFQPQVHKPIRTLGEPPGYYRQAHDLRPSKTVVVVARRSSCLIRHQPPSAVFTRSPLEHLFELLFCMLQSLYCINSLVEVSHLEQVL